MRPTRGASGRLWNRRAASGHSFQPGVEACAPRQLLARGITAVLDGTILRVRVGS